ncbi:hypothetical protein AA103587_0853 [Gluconobacter kanchanaburiensis NBRC 103587]|nr:hypothetical protein AA103587_0853 [Gluconobacter kanchanaburiensis NBRC 103587]
MLRARIAILLRNGNRRGRRCEIDADRGRRGFRERCLRRNGYQRPEQDYPCQHGHTETYPSPQPHAPAIFQTAGRLIPPPERQRRPLR